MSAEVDEIDEDIVVMPLHEWHLHRRKLMADEERERAHDLGGARPHIQAAVTERAIRELYARVDALAEIIQEAIPPAASRPTAEPVPPPEKTRGKP